MDQNNLYPYITELFNRLTLAEQRLAANETEMASLKSELNSYKLFVQSMQAPVPRSPSGNMFAPAALRDAFGPPKNDVAAGMPTIFDVCYQVKASGNIKTPRYVWQDSIAHFPRELDCKVVDSYGNNALCHSNCPELTAYLISQGVSVNAGNNRGLTPLHFAYRNPRVVDLLVQAGANVNAVNQEGQTPLFLIKDLETTKKLVSYGANVHHRDDMGNSLLHKHTKGENIIYLMSLGLQPTPNVLGVNPGERSYKKNQQ